MKQATEAENENVTHASALPHHFRRQKPLARYQTGMAERTASLPCRNGGRFKGTAIEIGGVADHVHLLVRIPPTVTLSDFLRDLKAGSSGWAKKHDSQFSWQRRYGAFTVSESIVPKLRIYIQTQEEHHKKETFETEYKKFLRAHKIEFDEKYLWE